MIPCSRFMPVTVVLLSIGCAPSLNLDDSTCPCAAGWTCCAETGQCVTDAGSCDDAPDDQVQATNNPAASASEPFLGKTDILLVVDNTPMTTPVQQSLLSILGEVVKHQIATKTHYRIGITSTDALGHTTDCSGNPFDEPAGLGDCADPTIELRRPHDGTLGRLVSAYDPAAFASDRFTDLDAALRAKLVSILPTGVATGPDAAPVNQQGVPWVIDATDVRTKACGACDCTDCAAGDACFDSCARPLEQSLVDAYWRSNVSGLGIYGKGWEQGITSALLAVGIDPTYDDTTEALNPPQSLVAAGGANTLEGTSWLREDARLLVLVFSNEDDCSMLAGALSYLLPYELEIGVQGSGCYQDETQPYLLKPQRLAALLKEKKSDVAVGFVGGIAEVDKESGCMWQPNDCAATTPPTAPISTCSCLNTEDGDAWCAFTQNTTASADILRCDVLAGTRYVSFASAFDRVALGSICGDVAIAADDLKALADDIEPASPRCLVADVLQTCPIGFVQDADGRCVELGECSGVFAPDGTVSNCEAALQCCNEMLLNCCPPGQNPECYLNQETSQHFLLCTE